MRARSTFVFSVLLLVACATGGSPPTNPPDTMQQPTQTPAPSQSATPKPTTSPTASPAVSPTLMPLRPPSIQPHRSLAPTNPPSPTATADPAAFSLTVLPAEDPIEARLAIPGERVVFLVVVGGLHSAAISAKVTGTGTATLSVPGPLEPGVVGEVALVTDQATGELSLTIRAREGEQTLEETRTVAMFDMKDERGADAQPYFDKWVSWLSDNRPDLGISSATKWDPEFVSTFLVVSHYAYWSDDWEMVVAWHNMIPPDDWTDVFLRRRGTDSNYTIGYRIDSVSGSTQPHPNQLPETLIR